MLRRLSCASTPACRRYSTTTYDIIALPGDGGRAWPDGGVLQTSNACLTVSPCCGMLVTVSCLRIGGRGFSCPACAHMQQQQQQLGHADDGFGAAGGSSRAAGGRIGESGAYKD